MKKQVAILAAVMFAGGMMVTPALAIEESKTPPGPPSPRIDHEPGPVGQFDYSGEKQIESGEKLDETKSSDVEQSSVTDADQQQNEQFQKEDQQQVATTSEQQIDFKAANNLNGMPILNEQGNQIGEVDKVLVDMDSGELAYVVVTKGGVLGVGEDKYVVPWNAIKTDTQKQGLVVTAKSDELKAADQEGKLQNQIDRQMGQEIHQYYGVSPYWEEGSQQEQQIEQDQQMDQMNLEQDEKSEPMNLDQEKSQKY